MVEMQLVQRNQPRWMGKSREEVSLILDEVLEQADIQTESVVSPRALSSRVGRLEETRAVLEAHGISKVPAYFVEGERIDVTHDGSFAERLRDRIAHETDMLARGAD